MSDKPYILVVEDEAGQAEVLKYTLGEAGFTVGVARNGLEALEKIETNKPDLLVLDWMMPEMSGIKLIRKLRAQNDTRLLPIIMLTARGEEDDKIYGFEMGADDYLVKPYLPSELVARIRSVLRRSRPDLQNQQLCVGDIIMNLEQKKVLRSGEVIQLGPTEFRLLKVFMSRPGKVFQRNQLLDMAWGHDVYVEDRTVDVAVRRLRSALNNGGKKDLFRTVRSEGYSIESE